ncbi:chaplin [Streptomyces sp. NPDC000931]|uniref:chaplin n=1 Tax=Streptomyces sp. NPDC000931 TaxID=3154372 RepID=UPI00331AB87C
MRQTLSRGVFVAAAAATGILSLYGTPALADSYAVGSAEESPDVLSKDTARAPVHAPVNLCGNTANLVGVGNDAYDNTCVNGSRVAGHGPSGAERSDSGAAHGDSEAAHAVGGMKGLPDVASRNDVQVPVDAPVNLCGNTVSLVGVGNDAYDNTCVNTSHGDTKKSAGSSYGESSHGDSSYGESDGAYGDSAKDSHDVLSGNHVRVPVHLPVNACGNNVGVIGLFNDSYGNSCGNYGGYGEEEPEKETPPPTHVKLPPAHEVEKPPAEESEVPGNPPHLAETGSDGMIAAAAAGAVLITGGAMVYRRGRTASRR